MLFLFLSFFVNCIIPEQFRGLAEKALLNSTIKVAKSLREKTKYPGNYTFGNAHFTLHKILSSSQTTDIKGYAIENDYAAIVKRKKFHIDDGFTLIDLQTQELYTMEKVVASDEKVNIYRAIPIDIFNVFSDIEAKVKTPMFTVKKKYHWDTKRDRPELKSFGPFSVGAGCFFSASVNAKAHFHSLKKAEIKTDITLIGKIGAELASQKGETKYPDVTIYPDLDIIIPECAISFKFLGLRFDFGVFLTFGAMLRDLEKKLDVDIDYFKGYQLTAKRYICIKRHGTSDSGWQTDFSPMPSGNIIEGSSNNLEANKITATFQIKSGIKIKADIFHVIKTHFSFGILKQLRINFGFDALACPYPYLYGRFELPVLAFYEFSGVVLRIKFLFGKRKKYTLLKPNYKEKYLFSLLKTRKFCLYDTSNINDYILTETDDDADDDDQFINETSNRFISLDAKNIYNTKKTPTLMSMQLSLSEFNSSLNKQIQLFSKRSSQYEELGSKNSSYETTIVEAGQNRVSSKVSLSFWYQTGTNIVEQSDIYSFFLKDYRRNDDGYAQAKISNKQKTEEISVDFRIKYCEKIQLYEMYIPSLRMGIVEDNLEFGDKLCVIVKDLNENTTDYVDENAGFYTDCSLSESFEEHGVYTHKDEFFYIRFVNITLPSSPDYNTNVHYEISAEWGNNYEHKSLLISNFTKEMKDGTNLILDDYMPKVRITEKMRLFVIISYINKYNMIHLKQPISYLEIQHIAKTETMELIKTQKNNKISCAIAIQRCKPIIRINCSTANSTHRIVTQVYTLDSVKPSEYKPTVIHFREKQFYGVFELKKLYKNVKCVIIHMPFLQPLCNFTMISDDYYQIPFEKDVIYIPFRREESSNEDIIIKNVIQGNLIDEETIFFSNKYYKVDFDEKPVSIAFVRTINNQYSVTGIERTKQTLVNYSDPSFQILALEYDKDKIIYVSSSLIIIDDKHPLAEKTIQEIPNLKSITYHVWCERADEIMIHDKTSGVTTEKNTEKDGSLFKLTVTPGHIIDFIPICMKDTSQSMCYIKQTFPDQNSYAIFKYPDKNGITVLDTSLEDLFEQKDRQGLIEEVIKTKRSFYYMSSFSKNVQMIRTYKDQLDLQLRVIEVQDKYKKFCITDPDGFIVPVSREYYTDEYSKFMKEFGISNEDIKYLDFLSGDNDSCIYATYNSSNYSDYEDSTYNDTDSNDTYYTDYDMDAISSVRLLTENSQEVLNPSTKICDLAKSIKVSYYKDMKQLIPPANFDYEICKTPKVFEDEWVENMNILNYEISEYFLRAKLHVEPETNRSIYVLDLPYDEIKFDIALNEDEYINGNRNFTIHYISGTLNYILPENYHTVIDLGNLNEISLNLLGKGTVEFKTTHKSSLKINGNLNIDSNKIIQVDNDVKLLEISNVNVANYVELNVMNNENEQVNLKINNLTLLEHSTANFTNVEVSNALVIKQTATAIFDTTVTIKNSELYIQMIAYQNDLIPMIKGALNDPPKTIYIDRISDDGPRHDDEYMIFDGQFDCQSWIKRMKFGNSYFNNARCANHNYNDLRILETEECRAFVSFVKKDPANKKDFYMTGGLITIIVFSILDFGLLVFLVVILILKKRGKTNNNNQSENVDYINEALL